MTRLEQGALLMRSIRGRMLAGFGAIMALLLVAGVFGYSAMTATSRSRPTPAVAACGEADRRTFAGSAPTVFAR